jgi:hypothetical protein
MTIAYYTLDINYLMFLKDEFTVLSHHRAAKAHADGIYEQEIIPVAGSTAENGIKADTSYEKVSLYAIFLCI